MTTSDHHNRARGKRRTKTGAKPGSTAAEALRLIQAGMHPVPVPHKGKGPVIDEWQKLRMVEETVSDYFDGQPMNIGVLLGSRGLCDIDLDCPEALAAADEFLPETDFEFGRRSKPRSHR